MAGKTRPLKIGTWRPSAPVTVFGLPSTVSMNGGKPGLALAGAMSRAMVLRTKLPPAWPPPASSRRGNSAKVAAKSTRKDHACRAQAFPRQRGEAHGGQVRRERPAEARRRGGPAGAGAEEQHPQ